MNDSIFVVQGWSTGPYEGEMMYDSLTRTATFDPLRHFKVGEGVTVVLTDSIQSSQGVSMEQGYVWSFTVLAEDGSAVFQTDSAYAVDASPYSVWAGDFDGDGDVDLVSTGTRQGGYRISAFINDGNATFTRDSVYSVTGAGSLTSADFDGDGDLDLATVIGNRNYVSVILNNGDGTFDAGGESLYDAYVPYAIASGDLDGDGDIDLAVTRTTSDVQIFLNDGSGIFAPTDAYPVSFNPWSIVCADLDGDADLDIAVANANTDDVSILLNDGRAVFSPDSLYPVGEDPRGIFAADLDGDGDLDLAAVTFNPGQLLILRNRAGMSISGVVFNDLNGSGYRDMGEPGLPRWILTLEPGGSAAITNDRGEYVFKHLDAGSYTVGEVVKVHWEQTSPDPPGTYAVPLDTGDVVTGIDFGNQVLTQDTLDGVCYLGFTRLRPGRPAFYTLQLDNIGTVPWDSARSNSSFRMR